MQIWANNLLRTNRFKIPDTKSQLKIKTPQSFIRLKYEIQTFANVLIQSTNTVYFCSLRNSKWTNDCRLQLAPTLSTFLNTGHLTNDIQLVTRPRWLPTQSVCSVAHCEKTFKQPTCDNPFSQPRQRSGDTSLRDQKAQKFQLYPPIQVGLNLNVPGESGARMREQWGVCAAVCQHHVTAGVHHAPPTLTLGRHDKHEGVAPSTLTSLSLTIFSSNLTWEKH